MIFPIWKCKFQIHLILRIKNVCLFHDCILKCKRLFILVSGYILSLFILVSGYIFCSMVLLRSLFSTVKRSFSQTQPSKNFKNTNLDNFNLNVLCSHCSDIQSAWHYYDHHIKPPPMHTTCYALSVNALSRPTFLWTPFHAHPPVKTFYERSAEHTSRILRTTYFANFLHTPFFKRQSTLALLVHTYERGVLNTSKFDKMEIKLTKLPWRASYPTLQETESVRRFSSMILYNVQISIKNRKNKKFK